MNITALKTRYQSGESPRTILTALHTKITQSGTSPIWITLITAEQLADRLTQLESWQAEQRNLPLYGIPFAVKDNIDVAGLPTTAACPAFAYTPEKSAPVVTLLEQAGAILLGKTNLDQFATGLVGTRTPYGIPTSIYSAEHVSGGSSSGSAVAVAHNLVCFALGTDTAGSGRIPAAFNNIVGLKPTKGLISTTGVVPACKTLDCVSIFAHTPEDAASILAIAAHYDRQNPFSRNATPTPKPQTLAIGIPKSLDFQNPEPKSLFEAFVKKAEQAGAIIKNFNFEPFAKTGQLLYAGPWVAERLAALHERNFTNFGSMDPNVAKIISSAQSITAAETFAGIYERAEYKRQADAEWQNFDIMLLPTAPHHPRLDEVAANPITANAALGQYTNFVNLLDYAAIAVPAGFHTNGLPFGVTLIGPAFSDHTLLEIAAKLAAETHPVKLAVVGAHLTGQPLNHQLTSRGAEFLQTTRTAPAYRLFALANTNPKKPALVRDSSSSAKIEIEIWSLSHKAFGEFTAEVPAPLAIGTVTLENGESVKGFVCESAGLIDAVEITQYGGWRAYLGQPS